MNYQAYDYLTRGAYIMHEGFSLLNDIASHPSNLYGHTLPGRITRASLETAMRLTQRYEKLGFNIDEIKIDDKRHKVKEEVVFRKPFCDLIHFHRAGVHDDHKVLLVAPLSGHFATLLKGTVEALLPDHEIYVTDWADAREVPLEDGPFSFDCYVGYLIEMLEFLGPGTHLMAICQPTVQALIATVG